jgi:hypothetical protein
MIEYSFFLFFNFIGIYFKIILNILFIVRVCENIES